MGTFGQACLSPDPGVGLGVVDVSTIFVILNLIVLNQIGKLVGSTHVLAMATRHVTVGNRR